MNTFTASPAGGCVTIAVTRHDGGVVASPLSTAAETIVVFGSVTAARLSHERTGSAFA